MPPFSSEIVVSQSFIAWTRVLEPKPVTEAEEAAAYDALASRYGWLMSRRFIALVARIALENGRILDVGTGPGWVPIALAKRGPGWEIVAVDASEAMLQLARRNANDAGVGDRMQFVHGDAADLPFPDGSFDLVFSHFLLHHLDRPEGVFDEAARVTRKGGRIVFQDFLRPPRWKTGLLALCCRYLLGQSKPQVEMYRNSLAAALTLAEVQSALKNSRLARANLCALRGAEFAITAQVGM